MSKKGGGKQVITNEPDAATKARNAEIFNRYRDVANQPYQPYGAPTVAGLDPASAAAGKFYGSGMGIGRQGLDALGGDAEAFGKFFNPFQANVLDQIRGQYGRLSDQATMGINDQATRAGAFGGARHGIAQGTALGEIGRGLGEQMSNFQYQGYNDAMGRAGQAANLGLGFADRSAAMGDYNRNVQQQGLDDAQRRWLEQRDWQLRQAGILKEGASGAPSGTTQTQPYHRNIGSSAAGGAASGLAIGAGLGAGGGPIGAGIGAGLGILGLI